MRRGWRAARRGLREGRVRRGGRGEVGEGEEVTRWR